MPVSVARFRFRHNLFARLAPNPTISDGSSRATFSDSFLSLKTDMAFRRFMP